MGYTTEFRGYFQLDKTMKPKHADYLLAFNQTRRMKRDSNLAEQIPDPKRLKVNLPIGMEGEFFVAGAGFMGQDNDNSVIDYNSPPGLPKLKFNNFIESWRKQQEHKKIHIVQPSLWCQWTIGDGDGAPTEIIENVKTICWDGGEKFYSYVEWIKYIVDKFIIPWGYKLNGIVEWRGEDWADTGSIEITDNVINVNLN